MQDSYFPGIIAPNHLQWTNALVSDCSIVIALRPSRKWCAFSHLFERLCGFTEFFGTLNAIKYAWFLEYLRSIGWRRKLNWETMYLRWVFKLRLFSQPSLKCSLKQFLRAQTVVICEPNPKFDGSPISKVPDLVGLISKFRLRYEMSLKAPQIDPQASIVHLITSPMHSCTVGKEVQKCFCFYDILHHRVSSGWMSPELNFILQCTPIDHFE